MIRVLAFAPGSLRVLLVRAGSTFVFWLSLAGANPRDVAAGALAAIVATWASLHLWPPGQWRLHPVALVFLVLRFLYQSVRAGVDVGLRALDPRLPLRPGFKVFHTRLPIGSKRDAFCTMTSLLPGTLPVDSNADGDIVFHCLDVTQPVLTQLARDEAFFVRAFGARHD
jgi:multicomponent Na+:H+ antiporter subunit E